MKNIFVKFLFVSTLFCTQFAMAQSAKAKPDADETPEKAAMKMQLHEQRMQQIQLEKQQGAKNATTVPDVNQNARLAGSAGGSFRTATVSNSKVATSGSNKANQHREARPLGGVASEKVTAIPGTILDKQATIRPAGKQ